MGNIICPPLTRQGSREGGLPRLYEPLTRSFGVEVADTVELTKTVKGKSGLLTTEFWKSAVVDVLALLTMVGEIKPTGNPKYDSIISAAAGLAAAANNIGYANGRSKTKAAQAQAASYVVETPTTTPVGN